MNKTINGRQCTAVWHVDDIKMSHFKQDVLDSISDELSARYGKESPLTVQKGTVHDNYLGMTINYSDDGKVKFIMDDFGQGIIDEASEEFGDHATTPATENCLL